jgi:hypothetical protein
VQRTRTLRLLQQLAKQHAIKSAKSQPLCTAGGAGNNVNILGAQSAFAYKGIRPRAGTQRE